MSGDGIPWGAIIGAAGSAAGGLLQAGAAKDASQAQVAGQQAGIQNNSQFIAQLLGLLGPYAGLGTSAIPAIQQLTGTGPGGDPTTASLTSRFAPTMASLESTPGYQFVRDQGLKATQNGMAGKGLGSGAPAGAAAAQFAEGLAGTTFQNQFNNWLAQNSQINDILQGLLKIGGGAAGGFGTTGGSLTNANSNLFAAQGAAQGVGDVAQSNAFANLFGNLGSSSATGNLYWNSLTDPELQKKLAGGLSPRDQALSVFKS